MRDLPDQEHWVCPRTASKRKANPLNAGRNPTNGENDANAWNAGRSPTNGEHNSSGRRRSRRSGGPDNFLSEQTPNRLRTRMAAERRMRITHAHGVQDGIDCMHKGWVQLRPNLTSHPQICTCNIRIRVLRLPWCQAYRLPGDSASQHHSSWN